MFSEKVSGSLRCSARSLSTRGCFFTRSGDFEVNFFRKTAYFQRSKLSNCFHGFKRRRQKLLRSKKRNPTLLRCRMPKGALCTHVYYFFNFGLQFANPKGKRRVQVGTRCDELTSVRCRPRLFVCRALRGRETSSPQRIKLSFLVQSQNLRHSEFEMH